MEKWQFENNWYIGGDDIITISMNSEVAADILIGFLNPWISVDDRLPILQVGTYEWYLVAVNDGIVTDVTVGMFMNNKWDKKYVTHWMPLPVPPNTRK